MHAEFAALPDVDAWMALVEEMRGNFPGLETPEGLEDYRNTLLRFIGKHQALCVRDGSAMAGVMLFSRRRSMICCLGVSPRHRRRGVAAALMEAALREMDPERDVNVSTFREEDEKGVAPRALYRRFGFEPAEMTVEFGYPNQRFVLHRGSQ